MSRPTSPKTNQRRTPPRPADARTLPSFRTWLGVHRLEDRVVPNGNTIPLAEAVGVTNGVRVSVSPGSGFENIGEDGTSNDVDFFSFSLNAGDSIVLDVDARDGTNPVGTGNTFDSFLRLFDNAGTQLASNDDATDPLTGVFSFDSALTYTAPTNGKYHIGVSGFGNSNYNPFTAGSGSSGSKGDYRLFATLKGQVNSSDVGDTLGTAASLSLISGQTVSASEVLGNNGFASGDVDLYRFDLQAGDQLNVDIDAREQNLPGTLDSIVRVFNASGVELARNDDGTDPVTKYVGLDSSVAFTAVTAGTYFVGVSSYSNFTYDPATAGSGTGGSTGDYRLEVGLQRATGGGADAGDTLATAQTVDFAVGTQKTVFENLGNNSFAAGDVDLYQFTLSAGDVVGLDIEARELNLPGDLDSILRVFNGAGGEIAVNDDANDPGSGAFTRDAALTFTANTAGTYFVGVSSFANFTYDPATAKSGAGFSTGDYQLLVHVERPRVTGDVSNLIASAAAVARTPGTPVMVNEVLGNNPAGDAQDVDLFRLDLRQGDLINLDIDARESNLPGNLDSVLRLFDAAGAELAINDDSADPQSKAFSLDSSLDYTVTADGTYYVGVSGYSNLRYNPTDGSGSAGGFGTGQYHLFVTMTERSQQTGPEPGDTLATARVVDSSPGDRTLPEAIANTPNDVDLYRLDLTAGDVVGVNLDARSLGLPGTLDSIVRVFNAAGTEIAVNDDARDPVTKAFSLDSAVEFTAPTAGMYYVGVSSFANFSYNPTVANSGVGGSDGDYLLRLNIVRASGGPGSDQDGGATLADTLSQATTVGLPARQRVTLSANIGNSPAGKNDVDIFRVTLAAGDTLSSDIDAREIGLGGNLDSFVRLFSASGVEVARNDDAADPDTGKFTLDSAVRFTAKTAGTYFVGVSSFGNSRYSATTPNGSGGTTSGDYRLVLIRTPRVTTPTVPPTPTPPPSTRPEQVVFITFDGGSAAGGPAFVQGVPRFEADDVGVPNGQRQQLIDRIVQFVRDDFISSGAIATPGTALNLPITLTTTRPTSGLFTSIFVGGGTSKDPLGVANFDVGNRRLNDFGRVYTDVVGRFVTGATFDQRAIAVADTLSHEIGHTLGLDHLGAADDGYLMQSGGVDESRIDDERFGTTGTLENGRGQNDVAILRDVLRTVANDIQGDTLGDASELAAADGLGTEFEGALSSDDDVRFFTAAGQPGEVLQFNLDARELGFDNTRFALVLRNPAGDVVAESRYGIDPDSGFAGDPYIEYRVPAGGGGTYTAEVSAEFDLVSGGTNVGEDPEAPVESGLFRLIVRRTEAAVVDRAGFQTALDQAFDGEIDEDKVIELDDSTRSVTITDSLGGSIEVRLTGGSARILIQLVDGALDNADIDSIHMRDVSPDAQLIITRTGPGTGRIREFVVGGPIAGRIITNGIDIEQMVVNGRAQRVRIFNGEVTDTLAVNGGAGQVFVLGLNGGTAGVSGQVVLGGTTGTVRLNDLDADARLTASGNVGFIDLTGGLLGDVEVGGNLKSLVVGQNSAGTVEVGGNVDLISFNQSYGPMIDTETGQDAVVGTGITVNGVLGEMTVNGDLGLGVYGVVDIALSVTVAGERTAPIVDGSDVLDATDSGGGGGNDGTPCQCGLCQMLTSKADAANIDPIRVEQISDILLTRASADAAMLERIARGNDIAALQAEIDAWLSAGPRVD